MQQRHSEQISVTYHLGGKIILNQSWKGRNVILPHNKIFYVLDGELEVITEKEKIVAKGGDMVLIPSGVKHSYNLTKLNFAEKFWIHFDATLTSNNLFDYYTVPSKIRVGKNDYVEKLFSDVLFYSKKNSPFDKLYVASGICSIVAFYFDRCVYKENRIAKNEIDKAVAFIKDSYSEKLSLDTIAKEVNLSPNYLIKKFREQTGYSPMQYANVIKMERAKFLIEQSSEPIGAIMEKLGFLDAAHFSKLFKNYSGYSPKKYREIYFSPTKN